MEAMENSENVKNAKKEFMKKNIQHKMNSSKDLWKGVKEHLGWKNSGAPQVLEKDGEQITDAKLMANAIQDAFQSKLNEIETNLGPQFGNYLKTSICKIN